MRSYPLIRAFPERRALMAHLATLGPTARLVEREGSQLPRQSPRMLRILPLPLAELAAMAETAAMEMRPARMAAPAARAAAAAARAQPRIPHLRPATPLRLPRLPEAAEATAARRVCPELAESLAQAASVALADRPARRRRPLCSLTKTRRWRRQLPPVAPGVRVKALAVLAAQAAAERRARVPRPTMPPPIVRRPLSAARAETESLAPTAARVARRRSPARSQRPPTKTSRCFKTPSAALAEVERSMASAVWVATPRRSSTFRAESASRPRQPRMPRAASAVLRAAV